MGKVAAASVTLGLALLGIGLPDLLADDAKLWVVIGGGALLIAGAGLWAFSRWTIVPRHQLGPAPEPAKLPTPHQDQAQVPTRMPLVEAIEQHATRLSDMLDARSATSPGPKGGLVELMSNREAFEASAPDREAHDRRTLAIYFEKYRTPGLPLFDEAVNQWWAGNPKLRTFVEKPNNVLQVRKVVHIFRSLAHNLREKETDKALEARGFRKVYVPVDEPLDPETGLPQVKPR